MNPIMFLNEVELDILIKNDNELGLATVIPVKGESYSHIAELYQNNMDTSLMDEEYIKESLFEGDLYESQCNTVLEAINKALNFWFLPNIKEIPDIKVVDNFIDAIDNFKSTTEKFNIFKIK